MRAEKSPSGVLITAIAIAALVTACGIASGATRFGPSGDAAVASKKKTKLPKNSVGAKQIKKNAVNGSKVKDNSLTGADVNASTLGTVPEATHAASADTANSAGHAGSADNANHAANSDRLEGLLATAFQLRVFGSCLPEEAIGSVNVNGSVGCVTTRGTPTGPASGDLDGTYPWPSIASGVITDVNIADGAITDAKIASDNKDGTASTPSLRTLGAGAQQAMPGNATPGGPPSGAAGGTLSGTYPDPSLHVTGGPCANGQALTNVSSAAALTCGPGVYSSANDNVAAGPNPFGSCANCKENVAVGPSMLTQNTGSANSALGVGALANNKYAHYNSAFGAGALSSNDYGGSNSAFGYRALAENAGVNQGSNSAFGARALAEHATGEGNTAVGVGAMGEDKNGKENSALGLGALRLNETGEDNVAVGVLAMFLNETGGTNSALGDRALLNNTSGEGNVALGSSAGIELTTGDNNIDIGTAVSGPAGESNTTRIGKQGTQNATYLAGVSGSNIGANPSVVVNGEGRLGVETSSRRFKTDIHLIGAELDRLMKLRPVSFRYRRGDVRGPDRVQFGLIAEQVAKVYPNLVARGGDGRPYTVLYQELPTLLLAQAQRQQAQIAHQRRQIGTLRAKVSWLMRHVQRH